MKTLTLLMAMVLAAGMASAQLAGISPNGGIQGQHINATLTVTGQFYFQNDSITGRPDVSRVKISLGPDSIIVGNDSLDYVSYNTIVAHFIIPATLPSGLYDVSLNSYTYGGTTLPQAFTIGAGNFVTGRVFHDVNRNGTQDAGEGGISGYAVRVDNGSGGLSDATGQYSVYALLGAHTISLATVPDDAYAYTTATSGTVTVNGPVAGPDFGLVPTRFLISASPGIDTAGTHIVLTITDSNVTQNSTLLNVGIHYGGYYFRADSFSVIDAAHIRAVFSSIPYFGTPYGVYGLGVSVRNNTYGDVRSFDLDSAVTIVGPIGFIDGYAYTDSNHNGIKDPNEPGTPGAIVMLGNHQINTDSNGYYSFSGLPNGAFTISCYDPSAYYSSCSAGTTAYTPSGIQVTINNDSVQGQNFGAGVPSSQPAYNLFIHPGWHPANPGFDRDYWIWYGNLSSIPAAGGVITFQYDPLLTYVSCDKTPASHDLATHTLTWNVDSIYPTPYSVGTTGTAPEWYGGWVGFNLRMHVPASATAGTLIHSIFSISPTANDCSLWDNVVDETSPITSSHDPNEKHANPYNTLVHGADSTIEYTIDFQNTGNASTHFVIVRDSLDRNLVPGSVRVTGASHHYRMDNRDGLLTFTFDPCVLSDSATDEKHSKGSISFMAKLKPNLAVGTVIRNTADIYFDYNEPVRTNTTVNTITAGVGIAEVIAAGAVSVHPNPFSDATTISFANDAHDLHTLVIYDVLGHEVTSLQTSAAQVELSGHPFASGVYIFRLTDQVTMRTATGRMVVE